MLRSVLAMESQEDKQKPKFCRHKQRFPKKVLFESPSTSLGYYLWHGLHRQIFSLRNSFFCHIITKCGQNSRLGILLLASIEPPFNSIFLFTLRCIQSDLWQKYISKKLFCVSLRCTHSFQLCPLSPEICPRMRGRSCCSSPGATHVQIGQW